MMTDENLVGFLNYTQQETTHHNAVSFYQRMISQSLEKILLFSGQYYNPTKGSQFISETVCHLKSKLKCFVILTFF